MKVAEAFLGQCRITSVEAVLLVSELLLHAYVAEKNLIETLERENEFANEA